MNAETDWAARLAQHDLPSVMWSEVRLAVLDAARHGEVLSIGQVESVVLLLAAINRAQRLAAEARGAGAR